MDPQTNSSMSSEPCNSKEQTNYWYFHNDIHRDMTQIAFSFPVQVITDFDMTLSKYFSNGSRGATSFSESGKLSYVASSCMQYV